MFLILLSFATSFSGLLGLKCFKISCNISFQKKHVFEPSRGGGGGGTPLWATSFFFSCFFLFLLMF